jgi:hypothetical protein
MAVPYKQNDTLLQFLQHYKAHTLQFSFIFQTSPSILHRFAATCKRDLTVRLTTSRRTVAELSKICHFISSAGLVSIRRSFLCYKHTKSNDMESFRISCPVHRPVKLLSSHATQKSLHVVVLYIA